MQELGRVEIEQFLKQLAKSCQQPQTIYILGGGALCLLGNPRRTLDIDYTTPSEQLIEICEIVATEMGIELESVPIEEFVFVPDGVEDRHRRVDVLGQLTVYVYDPYTIALSKVARGFETDLEDVLFLLQKQYINFEQLAEYVQQIIPQAWDFDIDPVELQMYFKELALMWHKE
jgi:hypothetical protein